MYNKSRERRLLVPLLFGLGGAAVLIALCVWQVQRLQWKEGMLAEIDARMAEAAGPLPEAPSPGEDRYAPVTVDGTFGEGALHVLTSQRQGGPGYLVVQAFETGDGRRILVDRGYVTETDKAAVFDAGPVSVSGLLVWPRETDMFTPEPNLERNIWFARDVDLMSEALGTEPVLIVASQPTGDPSPRPVPVGVDIPNNHLSYAVTWGLLAALWLAMTGYLVYRITRTEAAKG
ncbi:SURF1 family protein [Halovulum sp. GXIMD14794]